MKKGPNAPDVDMSVLMGANVANEVAKGDFAEATVGCTDLAIGAKWVAVFNTPDFKVDPVMDVAGAELCGALKNVVALGAGFCDGLGFGGNTKAAIIRVGLKEMQKFCEVFYGDRKIKQDTFLKQPQVRRHLRKVPEGGHPQGVGRHRDRGAQRAEVAGHGHGKGC